jgi:Phytochelatin synthase
MLGHASASTSIRLDSTWQRADLLQKAWALPVARLYAPLLSQGFTSLCGPTSVANVLRSLGVPAKKNPLKGFGFRPMGLNQLVRETAEVMPAGWRVSAVRPSTVEALREELARCNDVGRRLISNFARASLFGSGSGHHSPIGGYLEQEDLAFVLDVNSHFGPWLVRTERLFEAMDSVADWSTGAKRGLARCVVS